MGAYNIFLPCEHYENLGEVNLAGIAKKCTVNFGSV